MFYYDYRDLYRPYRSWVEYPFTWTVSTNTGLGNSDEYRAYLHWSQDETLTFYDLLSFPNWKEFMGEDLDLYVDSFLEQEECSD